MALARNGPSASAVRRRDGAPGATPPLASTVRALENRPLAVRGEHLLGGEPANMRATLRRCRRSGQEPRGDESHPPRGVVAE